MGGHAVIDALLNTQTSLDLQTLASQALHGQPVLQPDYRITVEDKDGKSTDLTPVFAGRLISLTLTDNRSLEADMLDLSLDDSDGLLDIPNRGARLRVAIGWKGQPLVDKGVYTVDEIEHSGSPDTLSIRARSADLRTGLSQQRERSYHNQTVRQIITALAEAHKLKPVIGATLAEEVVPHLDQTSESDANLLTRLADQFDAIGTVKDGRLLFIKAGEATTASGEPMPAITLTRQDGDQHRFSIADGQNYTAVTARWQNADKGTQGEVTVDANTRYKRVHTQTKKGKTSKKTRQVAVQTEPVTSSAENTRVLRHLYASEATALRGARAAFAKLQRGVATFSLTLAIGRPELRTELPVTVSGWKPQIDATGWLVSQVTHTMGDGGYTTVVELEMRVNDNQ
ncbi:phage late control D family protein [Laribacter hongkongensis]|uniref:phage late control D family protein n=1 Tax=Laribacter hongkongensis TaxID=168471 RepID=UPI001EFCADAF|nr:phage late control D family protein [Laribacter hongkongensis]MCG9095321.1 phage late control D family protein [Laribacter hongkongensis]